MSLIKSMTSGLSGLRSFQTKLNTIGNNIANVETTGFKSSSVTFSEVLSQQTGIGVRVSSINRNFSQGSLNPTGIKTDLALEGNGFFLVDGGDGPSLTRSGNFIFDNNGFLIDRSGRKVLGYNSQGFNAPLTTDSVSPIRLDLTRKMDPKITENIFLGGNLNASASTYRQSAAFTALTAVSGGLATPETRLNDLRQTTTAFVAGDSVTLNFKANDGTDIPVNIPVGPATTLQDVITAVNTALGEEGALRLKDGLLIADSKKLGKSSFGFADFVPGPGNTGRLSFPSFGIQIPGSNGSTIIESVVFDSLGKSHSLVFKLTQTDVNTWSYETEFTGPAQILNGGSGTISFDSNGNLEGDDAFFLEFDPLNGAKTQGVTVNLTREGTGVGITQFTGTSSVGMINQDGFGIGVLRDFVFDDRGNIVGFYDNNQEAILSSIAIGDVANYDGLRLDGNSYYTTTDRSGKITVTPASGVTNLRVTSGSLEGSNVDLTKEFTEMITAQRAFQSSARVVSTSDEILSETVNLKR
jgi:flagellar hook protein FlgE